MVSSVQRTQGEAEKKLVVGAAYGLVLGSWAGAVLGLALITYGPWFIAGGGAVGAFLGVRVGLGFSEAGRAMDSTVGAVLGQYLQEFLFSALSAAIGCCVTLLAAITGLLVTILCVVR